MNTNGKGVGEEFTYEELGVIGLEKVGCFGCCCLLVGIAAEKAHTFVVLMKHNVNESISNVKVRIK